MQNPLPFVQALAHVRETADGMTISLGSRQLGFIDTPGHARHHHCVWDERSQGFFSGDPFGLSYREFDTALGPWLMPTTTPVQFDPGALRESVGRMLAYRPRSMYLTHYGPVDEVERRGAQLLGQLDDMVALANSMAAGPGRHDALKRGLFEIHRRGLRHHGSSLSDARIRELLALDLELNSQGIGIWLDRNAS